MTDIPTIGHANDPGGQPEGGTKIRVRMPNFRDGMRFVGALAAGDAAETLEALDRNFNQAAFVLLLKNSLRDPMVQGELLAVLADLWVHEPPKEAVESDEPPEEWEYDPPGDLVEKGQAVGREERWRSLSKRQKKRLVKRIELEELPLDLAAEFAQAFQELPYVKDFIESRRRSSGDGDGSSSTGSPAATPDGETRTSSASTAREYAES